LQIAAPNCNDSQETKKARPNRADCVAMQQAAMPCGDTKYPLGEANFHRNPRETRLVIPKAAHYAAHLTHNPA